MKYSITSAGGHSFGLVGNNDGNDPKGFEKKDAKTLFDILWTEIPSSTLAKLVDLINGMDSNLPGSPEYKKLLDEMWLIHTKKNAGYAGIDNPDRWANFRLSEEIGVPAWKGALIRFQDKYIRIKNLIKNPLNEQVGESVRDTLIDLAAYALIIVCLLDELYEKEKK